MNKRGTEIVLRGLETVLEKFGSFPAARYKRLEGLCLYDGGIDSAYENYALLLPDELPGGSVSQSLLAEVKVFFRDWSVPHIWPLFPGLERGIEARLDGLKIAADDVFFSMTSAIKGNDVFYADNEAAPHWVSDSVQAGLWAKAAWEGFDSVDAAPAAFVRFAEYCRRQPELELLSLTVGNRVAATGMLSCGPESAGIYYVATVPQFRGMGLGKAVMSELRSRARHVGCERLSLLATESGRPLYLGCGFTQHDCVPIRKISCDDLPTDGGA